MKAAKTSGLVRRRINNFWSIYYLPFVGARATVIRSDTIIWPSLTLPKHGTRDLSRRTGARNELAAQTINSRAGSATTADCSVLTAAVLRACETERRQLVVTSRWRLQVARLCAANAIVQYCSLQSVVLQNSISAICNDRYRGLRVNLSLWLSFLYLVNT